MSTDFYIHCYHCNKKVCIGRLSSQFEAPFDDLSLEQSKELIKFMQEHAYGDCQEHMTLSINSEHIYEPTLAYDEFNK